MKKRFNFSQIEERIVRTLTNFILIQIIIIGSFVWSLHGCQPKHVENTKKADVIIEDIRVTRYGREQCLLVISDSNNYVFEAVTNPDNYPVSELYDTLSVGDQLTVLYVDGRPFFRDEIRWVLDARSETETFRSIELYNQSKKGDIFLYIAVYSFAELILGGIVWFTISKNIDTIKCIYIKIKRDRKNRN